MKLHQSITLLATSAIIVFALVACGGSAGPEFGPFPAINKVYGDAPFQIKAPSSDSSGTFTYTSSNASVASIAGDIVTILAAGNSTITATQAASGKWSSAATTAVLTVSNKICASQAKPLNGNCITPALNGSTVIFSNHSWMPAELTDTWVQANMFCATTQINGEMGWRLPSELELSELQKNAKPSLIEKKWKLGKTWTSVAVGTSSSHKAVNLDNATISDETDLNAIYFTCIK
jgi:hypothetical protein